jgi:broad specificity phosphatase PhoE
VKLLLVRHAESQGNAERRLQGRREFPLTERGVEQAQALASRLATTPVAAIYASPISRSLHTAEVIGGKTGLEVILESRVQEYDFGEVLSGLTWQEIREKQPELATALTTNKSEFPSYPGEEGRVAFRDRVCAALREIASTHRQDEAVVVATHAGPIIVFVLETLGRAYSRPIPLTIDNASITTVEVNHKSARGVPEAVVTGLNDTCHLLRVPTNVWQET